MDDLRFDALTAADLDGALRLSTQAGWNQTAADWKRLLDLCPDGCIAGRRGGRLVATATLASYGRDAHWIGMVLVDESERGQGFGKEILSRAIRRGLDRGSEAIGLDATDLGRPVYLKQNLVDVAPIDRWGGILRPTASASSVDLLDRSSFEEVAALDRDAVGLDRSELLLHLAGEPEVLAWVGRTEGGAVGGYAFLRPGRQHAHLGPVVAEDPAVYGALLSAAALHRPGTSVLVDVLRDPGTGGVLARSGLEVRRRLMRMTYRRPQPLLMGPRVGAATAFEWG
jgi:GNAT superfamily N-acetyltransferase